MYKILKGLENFILPNSYPKNILIGDTSCIQQRRSMFRPLVGFTLVSFNWVECLLPLLRGKRCLEIMAGCGVLSYALEVLGVEVKATDNFQFEGLWNSNNHYWTTIENIDCIEAIFKYARNVDFILMSFPSVRDISNQCLCAMRKVNPSCMMILITEGKGGIAANNSFFDSIKVMQNDAVDKANRKLLKWNDEFISLVQ